MCGKGWGRPSSRGGGGNGIAMIFFHITFIVHNQKSNVILVLIPRCHGLSKDLSILVIIWI